MAIFLRNKRIEEALYRLFKMSRRIIIRILIQKHRDVFLAHAFSQCAECSNQYAVADFFWADALIQEFVNQHISVRKRSLLPNREIFVT